MENKKILNNAIKELLKKTIYTLRAKNLRYMGQHEFVVDSKLAFSSHSGRSGRGGKSQSFMLNIVSTDGKYKDAVQVTNKGFAMARKNASCGIFGVVVHNEKRGICATTRERQKRKKQSGVWLKNLG